MRASLIAVLAALAVAGLSGCGAEDVDPATIADAAEATSRAGGAKLSLEGTAEARGQEIEISGSGVMDAEGNSEIDTDVPGVGSMKQVFTKDYVMYQRLPGLEQQLGKEWAKVDLVEANRKVGIDLELLQAPGSSDPRQMLEQMKRSAEEIEEVGSEEVRGVDTTHYRARMDLRDIDHVPAARREEAERSVENLVEQTGTDKFPMEVWIGEDKLVRRLRIQMTLNNPAFGGKMEMDIRMDLFDYGTRVAIDVPADGEVADVTDEAARILE